MLAAVLSRSLKDETMMFHPWMKASFSTFIQQARQGNNGLVRSFIHYSLDPSKDESIKFLAKNSAPILKKLGKRLA
jgi:hypothetical protein